MQSHVNSGKIIRLVGIMALVIFFTGINSTLEAKKKDWVGTWSCAAYAADKHTAPAPYLENNTLRQVVRVSIGGKSIRIKFSNGTSATPVTMNKVTVAVSTDPGTSGIDASTLKVLTFDGKQSVTMDPYTTFTSDPLKFNLEPGANLAITTYYGECKTAPDMTFHYGSRTDSYLLEGDHTESEEFEGATVAERWYTINTIEVLAPEKAAAVAVLGNSITDGYGLHGGPKNKWTDWFSARLLENKTTSNVAVLNLGIGATWLTGSGVKRFDQDVLDQNGLKWIIIFYGVNDIGGNASAESIINAYKELIDKARKQGVLIYGGTITPFKGHYYYSPEREKVRQEVNEWIRTPGNFDACIDFDQLIRDPSDSEKMKAEYSNDWLHPSANGYRFLGESVDLEMFTDSE